LQLISVLVGAYLVLVAMLIGSFINLVADRRPRGESIVRPRSRCRACGRQLNLVDLMPVLGYAIRGGRCASCRSPIGITSPLVEAASGGLMAAALLWMGLWPGAVSGLALVAVWGTVVVLIALRRGPVRETNS
jgi:prepilin signal peptidase PulO-like enzyme (type II secretory pathway)